MTKEKLIAINIINILSICSSVFLIGEDLGYSVAFGMLLLAAYVRLKVTTEFEKRFGEK